jgi:hypothetical protein
LGAIFVLVLLIKAAQLCFALVNPYDYFALTQPVLNYLYLELGILCVFVVMSFKLARVDSPVCVIDARVRILKKLYLLPAVTFFLVMVGLKFTLGVSFQQLRDLFFFGKDFIVSFASINYLIFIYTALGYILFYIGVVSRDRRAVAISLLAMFIFDVAQGGRMFIYYAFFLIVSSCLVCEDGYRILKVPRKVFPGLLAAVVVGLCLLVSITVSRLGSGGYSFGEFLYIYLVAPIYLFSEAVKAGDVSAALGMRFGTVFMSLDWAIVGVAKLFMEDLVTLYALLDGILATGYYLNDRYGANAAFTSSFYIFEELGYFGVLLFPSLLLFISRLRWQLTRFIFFLLTFSFLISTREHFPNSPIFLISMILFPIFFERQDKSLSLKSGG